MQDTVNKAPNIPEIYAALAASAFIAGQGDEALDWIEKGLKVDPLSARLHLQKGRLILALLDRPEDAERAFESARSAAPDWTAIDLASGDAAFARNELSDGIQWYASAMEKDPQDHEIPAMIGRHLYNFGLDELADSMLQRARSIAPEAPWTQALQLEKLVKAGNHERILTLAAKLLAQDIEDRGGAFSLSVFSYVNSMIVLGNAARVADFFESLRPGISEGTYKFAGPKEFTMRFGLVFALNDAGDFERSQEIMTDIEEWADLAIPDWRQNDAILMNTSIASGAMEQAADFAVRDLSRPLGQLKSWRSTYTYFSWTEPLLDDPRIVERIEELERLTAAAAPSISAVFAANTSTN
jgi:Tfp pilus assembly protein PilF